MIERLNALQEMFRKLFGYAERKRIKLHLMTAEQELRCADVSHLSDELKDHRRRMLEVLHEYWKKEEFPQNTDYDIKTPQIRDGCGIPCAMAYLIERSGHEELVNLLATQNNLVHIDDVNGGPLISWLERFGLSKQEAARIQPGYEPSAGSVLGTIVIIITVAAVGVFALVVMWRRGKPEAEKE
jgi:hypothetical protein